MGIVDYLIKAYKKNNSGDSDPNANYFNSGYGNFGNTDPSFWSNPTPAQGSWGNPQGGGFSVMGGYQDPTSPFSLSPGGFNQGSQQYSLLDILSKMMQPQMGSYGGW